MSIRTNLTFFTLALGMISISGLARAEFTYLMTPQEVVTEVGTQLKYGSSSYHITREAKQAGLKLSLVIQALIKSGQNPVSVVNEAIQLNPSEVVSIAAAAAKAAPSQAAKIAAAAVMAVPKKATEITKAIIVEVPDQSKAIITAVLTVPGINPADVLAATASGESRERGEEHHNPAGTPSGSGGGRHRASPA